MCSSVDTKVIYLKPCPFCGGQAEVMEDLVVVHVACMECAAESPIATEPEYAAKQWNARYCEAMAYNVGFVDCCEYADYVAGMNQEKQALVTTLYARAKEYSMRPLSYDSADKPSGED